MSNVQIVAAYIVCNEAPSIAESIRSVKAYVDRFVIIDAAFLTNPMPDEVTHSTDNTRSIAEAACAAGPDPRPLYYIESSARLLQFYARNAYLELINPPDWVFVIDGDEVFYGDHATILATFASIREGRIKKSLALPVYTTAVLVPKMAPDVTPAEYALNPLVSTMGYMPRLFAADTNLRYGWATGGSTPVLTYRGEAGWPDQALWPAHNTPPDSMFLINHHTRQTHQSYLDDYTWATEQVVR